MSECIFCSIANGEIPAELVYEDELVAAFHDLNPLAPVHILVVPKGHYESIVDGVPADVLKAMADAIDAVTKATGIDKTGFRCITNVGEDGGQTVRHFHIHVLGGHKLDPTAGEKPVSE